MCTLNSEQVNVRGIRTCTRPPQGCHRSISPVGPCLSAGPPPQKPRLSTEGRICLCGWGLHLAADPQPGASLHSCRCGYRHPGGAVSTRLHTCRGATQPLVRPGRTYPSNGSQPEHMMQHTGHTLAACPMDPPLCSRAPRPSCRRWQQTAPPQCPTRQRTPLRSPRRTASWPPRWPSPGWRSSSSAAR